MLKFQNRHIWKIDLTTWTFVWSIFEAYLMETLPENSFMEFRWHIPSILRRIRVCFKTSKNKFVHKFSSKNSNFKLRKYKPNFLSLKSIVFSKFERYMETCFFWNHPQQLSNIKLEQKKFIGITIAIIV